MQSGLLPPMICPIWCLLISNVYIMLVGLRHGIGWDTHIQCGALDGCKSGRKSSPCYMQGFYFSSTHWIFLMSVRLVRLYIVFSFFKCRDWNFFPPIWSCFCTLGIFFFPEAASNSILFNNMFVALRAGTITNFNIESTEKFTSGFESC